MDNGIIAIAAFIVIVVGLAVCTELVLTVIGGIIGMIVFFLPAGLLACGANKLGINDGVSALLGVAWVIFAIVIMANVLG